MIFLKIDQIFSCAHSLNVQVDLVVASDWVDNRQAKHWKDPTKN